MSITVSGVLIGIVFALRSAVFSCMRCGIWFPTCLSLALFIGKMLAYVAVFLLMALWSVGHLAGCAGAALFLLFAGCRHIHSRQRS